VHRVCSCLSLLTLSPECLLLRFTLTRFYDQSEESSHRVVQHCERKRRRGRRRAAISITIATHHTEHICQSTHRPAQMSPSNYSASVAERGRDLQTCCSASKRLIFASSSASYVDPAPRVVRFTYGSRPTRTRTRLSSGWLWTFASTTTATHPISMMSASRMPLGLLLQVQNIRDWLQPVSVLWALTVRPCG